MKDLTAITDSIYRLTVPFIDIFTTVYVIKTDSGALLFDTATYPEDADNYIIPALNELGVTPSDLKYIMISHEHRDHAGSLERLTESYPESTIVSRSAKLRDKYSAYNTIAPEDGDTLLDVLKVVTIPGHSSDSMGIIDTRTKTMLTGDSLQIYGIYGSGAGGSNIGLPVEHLAAIEKLRKLDIDRIEMSHDYHPCGHSAVGKDEITHCLDKCVESLYTIKSVIGSTEETDDEALAKSYNASSGLPTVSQRVFAAVRKAALNGQM